MQRFEPYEGKYYTVPVLVEVQAANPDDAKAVVQSLVEHLWKTGGSSNLACPEEITIGDDVNLVFVDPELWTPDGKTSLHPEAQGLQNKSDNG